MLEKNISCLIFNKFAFNHEHFTIHTSLLQNVLSRREQVFNIENQLRFTPLVLCVRMTNENLNR